MRTMSSMNLNPLSLPPFSYCIQITTNSSKISSLIFEGTNDPLKSIDNQSGEPQSDRDSGQAIHDARPPSAGDGVAYPPGDYNHPAESCSKSSVVHFKFWKLKYQNYLPTLCAEDGHQRKVNVMQLYICFVVTLPVITVLHFTYKDIPFKTTSGVLLLENKLELRSELCALRRKWKKCSFYLCFTCWVAVKVSILLSKFHPLALNSCLLEQGHKKRHELFDQDIYSFQVMEPVSFRM